MITTPTRSGRDGFAVDCRSTPHPPSTPRVFKAHVPETFDPSVTKPEWAAYACWLVSAVVIRRYLDKEADESTFVPLSAKYLRCSTSPDRVCNRLLDELIQAGVLETDGVYFFGHFSGNSRGQHVKGPKGKSLCYRLCEVHRGAKIRPVELTHKILLKKIAKYAQQERNRVTDPSP